MKAKKKKESRVSLDRHGRQVTSYFSTISPLDIPFLIFFFFFFPYKLYREKAFRYDDIKKSMPHVIRSMSNAEEKCNYITDEGEESKKQQRRRGFLPNLSGKGSLH